MNMKWKAGIYDFLFLFTPLAPWNPIYPSPALQTIFTGIYYINFLLKNRLNFLMHSVDVALNIQLLNSY